MEPSGIGGDLVEPSGAQAACRAKTGGTSIVMVVKYVCGFQVIFS